VPKKGGANNKGGLPTEGLWEKELSLNHARSRDFLHGEKVKFAQKTQGLTLGGDTKGEENRRRGCYRKKKKK